MTMAKNRRHDTGCCSVTFLKYVLHMFNVLFIVGGLSVLGVGLWSILDKHTYVSLLNSSTYSITSYVLLSAGVLVLFVAIIGCVAVIKHLRGLLILYTFLLLLIFLLEAMAGLLAFIYHEQVDTELKSSLNSTFLSSYGVDEARTLAIDHMQSDLRCCGAVRFEDWKFSVWFQNRTNYRVLVPDSCCKTPKKDCGYRDHPSNIHYDGCIYSLEEQVKDHLTIISAVGSGICILQIFGIIFGACLYIKLKNQEDDLPIMR